MSWLFSRALVEEFSAGICLDGELSALSSGNPTQLAFLSHGKTTAFSRPSRFGMTFRPLTDAHGAALLTWFLAASRARTSASRARATAWTESAPACGGTWRGWLAKYDPDSSSWRTAQCSFIEDSTESLVTLPRSGMTRSGLLWELPTLERRTSGIDSGLWPTPTVCGNYNRPGASATSGMGLASAVRLWPTPTSSLGDKGGLITPSKAREGGTLIEAISARTVWATPTRRDYKSGHFSPEAKAQRDQHSRGKPLNEQIGGTLNPTWVEWLMGWPLGWTDLKPLEMGKSPSAQPLPGDCSPLELEAA